MHWETVRKVPSGECLQVQEQQGHHRENAPTHNTKHGPLMPIWDELWLCRSKNHSLTSWFWEYIHSQDWQLRPEAHCFRSTHKWINEQETASDRLITEHETPSDHFITEKSTACHATDSKLWRLEILKWGVRLYKYYWIFWVTEATLTAILENLRWSLHPLKWYAILRVNDHMGGKLQKCPFVQAENK